MLQLVTVGVLTIKARKVFDPVKGREIDVHAQLSSLDESGRFELRRLLKEGHRNMLCCTCFQRLILAGRRNFSDEATFFYKHFPNSEDCPEKDGVEFSDDELLAMRFNGQKESEVHKELKNFIAETLRSDSSGHFSEVKTEKTFREENEFGIAKRWRIPDVSSFYSPAERRAVFELQMSITYLDVIIARENFYNDNRTFIVWVLLDCDLNRFSNLDIAYGNFSNLFVLNHKAIEKTKVTGELWFECFFREPSINHESLTLKFEWKQQLVRFGDLTFDDHYNKIYLKDIPALKAELLEQITSIKEQRKRKAEQEEQERIERQKRTDAEVARQQKLQRQRDRDRRQSQTIIRDQRSKVTNRSKISISTYCSTCKTQTKSKNVGKYQVCEKCAQPYVKVY